MRRKGSQVQIRGGNICVQLLPSKILAHDRGQSQLGLGSRGGLRLSVVPSFELDIILCLLLFLPQTQSSE